MAKKAKEEDTSEDREDESKEDGEEGKGGPKKAGLVGGILAMLNPLAFLKLPLMMKLIVGGGALVSLLIVGGAAYFFLSASPEAKPEGEAAAGSEQTAPVKQLPPQASFFDIPDIIVNLQTSDTTQAYLKLSVALELEKPELKTTIEPVMPRVIDQFQSYLRELRIEDIRGSAGVMRLKEELLRRVNLAAAPTPVRDVLLKEMIVQ